MREPPAGRLRSFPPAPSAPSSNPRNPSSATGSTTTAPAPSPKSTQVDRSAKFISFDRTSAPITSARLLSPLSTIPNACAIPYMNPVQPAARSYAAALSAPSRSARIAAVEGNRMSGVTVATISRSISSADTPACSRAARAAGREMSDSASSSSAKRRSLIPVRVTIHSSEVSTSFARSSFVTTLSGTCVPSPVIETGLPFATPIMAVPVSLGRRRKGERSADGQLVAHRRPGLAAADRPTHRLEFADERELVTGLDDALEAHVVDSCEERELAAVLLEGESGDRTGLRQGLDHDHARHDRPAREVPGEEPLVAAHLLAGDDPGSRLELQHFVDEQERVAVRDDLFDHLAAERRGRGHAFASRSRSELRPRWA